MAQPQIVHPRRLPKRFEGRLPSPPSRVPRQPDVRVFIDRYLTHLESKGASAKSLLWYRHLLPRFAEWLERGKKPLYPRQWDQYLVEEFYQHVRTEPKPNGQPKSPTSVYSINTAIRSFVKWLYERGELSSDVMAKVPAPKKPSVIKDALSTEEIKRVYQAVRTGTRMPLRDEAIFLFMIDTGCRAAEVCGLREDQIDWERRVAKVTGKGSRDRFLPFSETTAWAMERYRDHERYGLVPTLFETEHGEPLTPNALRLLLNRIGERAGSHLHPHKLRHTFAITFLRQGANVFALQKTLGHADVKMTRRYTELLPDDVVAAHQAHSPVAGIIARRRREPPAGASLRSTWDVGSAPRGEHDHRR